MAVHRTLHVVQLYPTRMNIYGDYGNLEVIVTRMRLYGYDVQVDRYETADDLRALSQADLVLGGGGQDSGQQAVVEDLAKAKQTLLGMAHGGVPMLMICGLYQLFGHEFRTKDQETLPGVGLFDMETVGADRRLIGNIIINTPFGEIIGYENHSGLTTLASGQQALGHVIQGAGNNDADGTEGAVADHVIGSYLHGPILTKNPKLADELILRAGEHRYGDHALKPADDAARKQLAWLDSLSTAAREICRHRPR